MSTATPPAMRPLMLLEAPLESAAGDYFRYTAYADAVAELIAGESSETPLTIAISGPWGAGKTSLAKLIEARLRERTQVDDRQTHFCWFDAWMHSEAPRLGVALAAHVATVANRYRPWSARYLLEPLPGAMLNSRERWRRRLLIGVVALLISITALSVHPIRDAVRSLPGMSHGGASTGSLAGLLIILTLLTQRLFAALESTANFVDDPASEAAHGSIADVRDQLGRLVAQALPNGRLVVFVDNLERCDPQRAMDVCEVANQLLSHPNVTTVFVADMHVIATAAEDKFRDASAEGDAGGRYLEKLVQLQITLPPPKGHDLKRLLTKLDPVDSDHTAAKARERAPGEQPASSGGERQAKRLSALAGTILDAPSDAPFLVVQDPLIGLPALALGALAGCKIASLLGAFDAGQSQVERLLGLPSVTSTAKLMTAGALAFEGAVLVCLLVAALLRRHRRRRNALRRHAIDRRLREIVDARQGRGLSEHEIIESLQLEPEEEDIARPLIWSYLIDHADELQAVEACIVQYAPGLPRGAKRMLNHARLLTGIAHARGLFQGQPSLDPVHLGAWIALSEHWPAIARETQRRHGFLGDLQRLVEDRQLFDESLRDMGEGKVDELVQLLKAAPRLGLLASRLVHFE